MLRVEPLGRSMRRVALGGPELAGFRCEGPTDHAKAFFPPTPDDDVPMPELVDGRWVAREGERPVSRDYTIRTFDPAAGEVVLDMAVHDHGPAGRWAAAARPGSRLGLLGPKTTKLPPTDRDWYLFAVDETGLPGLANWFDRLPSTARVLAFAEVDGPEDEVPLAGAHEVTWLHRGTAERGTTTLLADAVARAGLPGPTGRGWVWAAAEATAVRGVRRHVTALGVDRSCSSMTGYWRVGVAGFDHKSPEATD
ncbi:siderophore-interacting protein [Cellulomonas carbonis]|nr:siderophore-interacting protein [Cellulomonas carbonis]